MAAPGPLNLLTDVPGLKVGQAEDARAMTGVTVILPDVPAVAAVDVRGGAPGTRETEALDPTCLVDAVDAVVLSGGSVYGLEAASGVVAWLGARGRGYAIPGSPLRAPVVPSAILFDLANGGDKAWGETPPYRDLGMRACVGAGERFALGNAGAGLGAQAGIYKGGVGSASWRHVDGVTVGALAAVNAFGSPVMPGTDMLWAAPFEVDGEMGGQAWPAAVPIVRGWPSDTKLAARPAANTTIAVVATDADLSPAEAKRLAFMAHDGFARALRPVHTPFDGDTVFILATARRSLGPNRPLALAELGNTAADTLARAIGRAVYEAETLGGTESYRSCLCGPAGRLP